MLKISALLLLPLCISSPLSKGPQPFQDKEQTNSGGFILEAGEHALTDILTKAAEFLGRNYIMNAQDVANSSVIVLQKRMILDAIGCEETVSRFAYTRNLAIVPIDELRGLYEVISMRGQRAGEIFNGALQLTPEEVLKKSRLKVPVLTAVPLKHLDSARASQQLRPFFTGNGGRNGIQFGNPGNQNSILLRGYADQVAATIRLLRSVDVPERTSPSIPNNVYKQLSNLHTLTSQQAIELKATQTRLANIEALLTAQTDSGKKKER